MRFLCPFHIVSFLYELQMRLKCVLPLDEQQEQRFLYNLYLLVMSKPWQPVLPCFSQPYLPRPACF